MPKRGLQRRLLESHLFIAFAGILTILVLCVVAAIVGRSGGKLVESVGAIPNSSLSLINSIQASIAANHGWVYLGDRKFIEENRIAWESIDTALHSFQVAVDGNLEIISELELEEVSESISRLRKLQAGIVFLPSKNDRSSDEIHATNIKPVETQIGELLSEIESTQLLDRKVMLNIEKYFTETALQLELAIKSREYVDSQKYLQARDNLTRSTIPVRQQIMADELDDEHVLQKLNTALKYFIEMTEQANSSHEVESNNQVRQFLFNHAVPLSNSVVNTLQTVIVRAQGQTDLRYATIKQVTMIALIATIVALVGLIICAFVLSMNNANKLVSRLTRLSYAVESFSEDDSYKPIAVEGNDEISQLAGLFNTMALAIKENQKALKIYQNELELRVARRTRELFGAKEFAETTLRSVGDALITVDSDHVISMCNPAAERLTGVSADRAVGQSVASVLVLLGGDGREFDLTSAIAESMDIRQLLVPKETLCSCICLGVETPVPVKMTIAPIADMTANKSGSILILRNVERELELQSELSYQANHDQLTGLRNRASFNVEMDNILKVVDDTERTHVIAFLDLDKFKVVNDSCGHAAGDELLKQISRLLNAKLRFGDILARLGGDEFAILLRDCDIANGEAIALGLRDAVASHRFAWEGRVFSVGVSIGITACGPGSVVLKDILTDADQACYAAKAAGRNKVRVSSFVQASDAFTENSVLSPENLLLALREETPELKLQISGANIVPGGGPLYEPRLVFLDDEGDAIAHHIVHTAIERAGLGTAYDNCLLTKILSSIALHNQSTGSAPVGFMVRLSEALFNDSTLFDRLTSRLKQKSLSKDTLYFCFSEHTIFKNLESVRARLDVLNDFGIRTVMEEFSGNFSSIASIRGLAIDYLQIDPAIVNDMLLNPVHRIVVRTICELAHVSGKQTIVVGDFDAELHDELIKVGVNVILPDNHKQKSASYDSVLANNPPFVKAS